jgi:hypothetical protein
VLGLLLLLAAMLPLGDFLAGYLTGGGRLPDPLRPDASPSDASTLRITVRSSVDGHPIEGARILVEGLAGGEAELVSDGEGRATVSGLGRGPIRIEAGHAGTFTSVWTDPAVDAEIELSLEERSARRGHVRDAGGRPVAARVALLGPDGTEIATARTDPDGLYVLPDDPAGVSVCAQPLAGGAPAVAVGGDLTVRPGVEIEGRIFGAGRGELRLFGLLPAPEGDGMLPFRAVWPTDADGSFSGHVPGPQRIWATYDGRPLELRAGELHLPERAAARGRVLRSDGSPASEASLRFRPLLEGDFPIPVPEQRVTADAEGRFRAEGLARVRYLVELEAPGCASRTVPEIVPGPEPMEFRLDAGYALEGRIVDAAGLPVPSASVHAVGYPDPDWERPVLRTRADERGRFRIEGLGGEQARVYVTAPGYHPTTVEGVSGGEPLSVVLQRR